MSMEVTPKIDYTGDEWRCHAPGTFDGYGLSPTDAYLAWLSAFKYFVENQDAENV